MIVIGICDGEQTVRSLLASYVERYKEETNTQIQLLSYSTGEKLLKNYMLDMDLVFLEIPLRKMNGLKIAEYLRRYDARVRIVFLTTVLTYVLEAYDVGASNYILKPLSYGKFCKELARIHQGWEQKDERSFLEQSKNTLHKVYFHEIRYIETNGKNTLIHTEKECIASTRQMKQFEALLSDSTMVRCHAGYIVNLRYFHKAEASVMTLIDGTQIPVSRNRRKAVLAHLQRFYGEET